VPWQHVDFTVNRNRFLGYLTAACSLALLAPLLWPLLTGRVFVNTDLHWFHLPTRFLYQQALASGDTVLWTPSIFSGFYIHGEGQAGLFHPLHQALYRLLPLGAAFNLEFIINYLMAFAGTFWFMRRLRFAGVPALLGAMLFTFCGFNLLHHAHINMLAVVAHMPWLLAAADLLIVDDRPRARALAFAAVALILGSELLIGFPQAVYWNAIALAAFGTFRAWETRRWRRLAECGGAAAIGVLLGSIQLLPTLDVAAHSTRVDRKVDFALTYSLHPNNVIQLWSPRFFREGVPGGEGRFHEYGLYSSALLTLALPWVWIRRQALLERRALIVAATVFAVLALLLALGRYGGIGVLLAELPVFRDIRAPARHIVLVQFALVVLAVVTFEDLLAIAEGRRREISGSVPALWVPLGLAAATTIALNSGRLPFGKHTFATIAQAAPGIAWIAAVTLLVYLAGRRVAWALAALVIVTTMDLAMWGMRYVYRNPAQPVDAVAAAAPRAPDETAASYAFVERDPYLSNVLVLRGYRLTSGYAGLFPASRHPLEGERTRVLSGTRWVFPPDGVRRPFEGAVDRVRLLDEHGQPASGSVNLAVDRPGRLVAEIDAPGLRVVAFTERLHAGWSATAGDAPLQVVPVEGDFLGCVVDGGVQRVTLTFMPRSFVYGSGLSAIGMFVLVGILFVTQRRARISVVPSHTTT
jgi:hypothetical protein